MRPMMLTHEVTKLGIRLLDDAHTAWVIAQVECADALARA